MNVTPTLFPTGENENFIFYQTYIDGHHIKAAKDKKTGEVIFDPESIVRAAFQDCLKEAGLDRKIQLPPSYSTNDQ